MTTRSRVPLLAALLLCGAGPAIAQTVDPVTPATRVTPAAPAVPQEARPRKNFLLPIAEIIAGDTALNLANRLRADGHYYKVTLGSIRRNLQSAWVIDDDPFQINQFLHPYQGAMYHGAARSAGLNYWQSTVYAFAGSALWEIAGEITPPSRNDQIASGIGGPFFGEPLYRMSHALLHGMDGTRDSPNFWHVLGATVISPPGGINHMMFGDRYRPTSSSNTGAVDLRMQLGVTGVRSSTVRAEAPLTLNRGLIGLSIDYGLPGRSNYAHKLPFDYFSMEATASAARGAETVSTRGLVAGSDYNRNRINGVWGLYGHYDYLSSEAFRFSTTAMSLGTSVQFQLSEPLTLQMTTLAGIGYSAAQTVRGTTDQDFHYGLAPQGLIAARLIAGRRFAVDVSAREYYISGIGAFTAGEHDNVFRSNGSLSLRLFGRHAVAVTYSLARRQAFLPGIPVLTQRSESIGVMYTLLGSGGFGAIR